MIPDSSIQSARDHFLQLRTEKERDFMTGLLYACHEHLPIVSSVFSLAGPELIEPGNGSSHDLGMIYRIMFECYSHGRPLDLLSITTQMDIRHQKGKGPAPDAAFLASLVAQGIYPCSFLEHSTSFLLELKRREQLCRAAEHAATAAYDMGISPDLIIADFAQKTSPVRHSPLICLNF